jgi:solute carrier family 25 S-adenosylmethionine transporter 26
LKVSSKGKTAAPANTPLYFLKVALAGGIAGAVGSAALYPMDAAKTLRQSSPSEFSSVFQALGSLIMSPKTPNAPRTFHLQNVYRGVLPATLGAIPSSALYFGAYESMKSLLTQYFPLEDPAQPSSSWPSASSKNSKRKNNFTNRLMVHALAAMSGNILSSAVFVPKELIKQQLQYRQAGHVMGVLVDIVKEKGIGGLYVGYKTTLLRNIPTAVLRFSLYEEFRYRWNTLYSHQHRHRHRDSRRPLGALGGKPLECLPSSSWPVQLLELLPVVP